MYLVWCEVLGRDASDILETARYIYSTRPLHPSLHGYHKPGSSCAVLSQAYLQCGMGGLYNVHRLNGHKSSGPTKKHEHGEFLAIGRGMRHAAQPSLQIHGVAVAVAMVILFRSWSRAAPLW